MPVCCEGLPLVFYEEVCKSFTEKEEQKAGFTVPRYGHILEAVANCVHTLLRENTELQDAQRSDTDLQSATSSFASLGHLADLAPLSFTSLDNIRLNRGHDRSRDRRDRDAPELHREIFVMQKELANSREEVRQLSVQKEVERDMQEAKLCKVRGDMSQMQLEMDELQQAHLQELFVFQEELQKLRFKSAESRSLETKPESETRNLFPRSQSRWQKEFMPEDIADGISGLRRDQPERSARNVSDRFLEMKNTVVDSQYSFHSKDPAESAKACEVERVEPKQNMQSVQEGKSLEGEDPTPTVGELPTFGSPEMPKRYGGMEDVAALKKAYSFAESLCDAQRYREALPLLEKIIDVGRSKPDRLEAAGIRPADVWAYLGVAKQGESLTNESIKAYCEAIRLDPLLHVCHANLASLYSFQDEDVQAQHHIAIALRLDPESQAYVELAKNLGFS